MVTLFFIIRQLSFATKIINSSGIQLFWINIELCPLDMNWMNRKILERVVFYRRSGIPAPVPYSKEASEEFSSLWMRIIEKQLSLIEDDEANISRPFFKNGCEISCRIFSSSYLTYDDEDENYCMQKAPTLWTSIWPFSNHIAKRIH